MCGIFGLWNFDGKPIDTASVRRGTNALRHRGPNDEGYLLVNTRNGKVVHCGGEDTDPQLDLPSLEDHFGEPFNLGLGFRRLSILDLSPAGHQPMSSPDGRLWIIFNGEVYNYIELRAELAGFGHEFHTGTDTEVILAAYQQWGANCLNHFNGMWAMAIWNNVERSLFIARDRFGIKPLFYTVSTQKRTFAFASEMKALMEAGAVSFRPAPMAVARYIAFQQFPQQSEGETFFEGIEALPASHFAMVRSGEFAKQRYWSIPEPLSADELSLKEITDRYQELFTDAVRLRLRADVPVGSCLSGGLDSSSIVAVAGRLMHDEHAISLERLGDHQQTFSAVYSTDGAWNERAYIDQVLEMTSAAANFVFPTEEWLWKDLSRIVWHQEEPFGSTSIFAQWCVMQLAHSRGVTVLLDGQGADEIFGGYYRVLPVYINEMVTQGRLLQALRAARKTATNTTADTMSFFKWAVRQRLAMKSLPDGHGSRSRLEDAARDSGLSPDLKVALLSQEEGKYPRDLHHKHRTLHDCLKELIYEDSLPHVLRHEDRNSMAFSLEARIPFLDYRLVEFVFRFAGTLRIRDGWTKWLQRVTVDEMLPSEIAWRRDKVGFETPERQWLTASARHLLDMFAPGSVADQYLDSALIRREISAIVGGVGDSSKAWRWINLAAWLRVFASERSYVASSV
jgi:asparagine synthase (glutamine-hydrolysing)